MYHHENKLFTPALLSWLIPSIGARMFGFERGRRPMGTCPSANWFDLSGFIPALIPALIPPLGFNFGAMDLREFWCKWPDQSWYRELQWRTIQHNSSHVEFVCVCVCKVEKTAKFPKKSTLLKCSTMSFAPFWMTKASEESPYIGLSIPSLFMWNLCEYPFRKV